MAIENRMPRNRTMVSIVFLTFFVMSLLTNILGPIVPDIISSFQVSLAAAALLPDGEVLVAGGESDVLVADGENAANGWLSSYELYSGASPLPPLPEVSSVAVLPSLGLILGAICSMAQHRRRRRRYAPGRSV